MINFEDITRKILDDLNLTILKLQENEEIKSDTYDKDYNVIDRAFKIRAFDNDGEYENATYSQEHFYKDKKEPEIIMCIRPAGGVQDTTLSVNVNIQIIDIEVAANVSQMDDIKTIFDTFSVEHRSKDDIINGSQCKIEISEFPQYGPNEKGPIIDDSFDEIEIFKTHFILNVTEFENTVMSNEFHLVINDEEMKYDTIGFAREYEKEFDTSDQQRTEAKSFTTGTVFGFTVNMLYQNTPICNLIVSDILSNSFFGQTVHVRLLRNGDNQLEEDEVDESGAGYKNMLISSGKIDLSHGKIVSLSFSLIPGLVL